MAREQKPFGGAPRLGNSAPGEPNPSPQKEPVSGFGGAPTLTGDRSINRGDSQVSRSGGGEVVPDAYGGGETMFPRRPAPGASGSGDDSGAGSPPSGTAP